MPSSSSSSSSLSSSSSSSSSNSAGANSVWVTIETNGIGAPSGTVVPNGTSAHINASEINSPADWHKFVFPGDVVLSASTKYWIVLHGDYLASDANYISWRADGSAASFANGEVAYHQDGGSWIVDSDDDFMFRLIESPAGTNYKLSGSNLQFESGELTCTYYTNIKDIGYIADVRILINTIASVSQGLTWSSDATRRFNDSTTLRFSGEETPGLVSLEIRTSEDNVTWTDWDDWISADYTCRYYQIKMIVTRESADTIINVSELVIQADLPDVDEIGTAEVTVANDGVAVTFSKTFHEAPAVNITITSGDGIAHQFTVAPTTTGFTVKLLALDGTAKIGTISFHAHGI